MATDKELRHAGRKLEDAAAARRAGDPDGADAELRALARGTSSPQISEFAVNLANKIKENR